MTPTRRSVLGVAGVLVAVGGTAAGLVGSGRRAEDTGALFLTSDSAGDRALSRILARSPGTVARTHHRIGGLRGTDFADLRARLRQGAGRPVFALVDDAHAVVIESLLGATSITRSRLSADGDLAPAERHLILLVGKT